MPGEKRTEGEVQSTTEKGRVQQSKVRLWCYVSNSQWRHVGIFDAFTRDFYENDIHYFYGLILAEPT